VLLVPSLWAEARSRIVVEAMLRGVPVIASNIGGIPEAMLGVDYLLPVRPIERYQPRVDEQMVPVAEVPEQEIGPWQEALERLVADRLHWEALSRASREAALAYAEGVTIIPFERYIEGIARSPRRARSLAPATPEAKGASSLERLTPEKRALLALRLKQKSSATPAGDLWFPKADSAPEPKVRLFCFAHAGGGTSAFRTWQDSLPHGVRVCAARIPGRESRRGERSFTRMDELVDALGTAMEPYLGRPFAFFGHSMGAAVAFELARRLRRASKPLPAGLFVAGARAPQFRLGHAPPPEPSEGEFLEQVRRLEGVPTEVLEHEDLLKLILPALKADAALYRNYVYRPEPPLNCPIRAYGGEQDPNVRREHLEAWGEQTTGSFTLRMLAGGHFFLQSHSIAFLRLLAADVRSVLP
jgi:medium-chain acyl-[acyl-carrier-protein] hydrolase